MPRLNQSVEHIQTIKPLWAVWNLWTNKGPDLYRLSEAVENKYKTANSFINFGVTHVYLLQTPVAVKTILNAKNHFSSVYNAFAKTGGLKYEFTSTVKGNGRLIKNNGKVNFWYLAHHGFIKSARGDKDKIRSLIHKHLPVFLRDKHFKLDISFEKFFNAFWCDYLFGDAVDANVFTQTKNKLLDIMRYGFYNNRLKSLDPFQFTSKFWGWLKRNELTQAKAELKQYIRQANGGWVKRFRRYLVNTNEQKNLDLSPELIENIIENNIYNLFFEPDFLSSVMYEALVEVVNKQLNLADKTDRETAYTKGLHRGYLYPYRARVLDENVKMPDGRIIAKNSLVLINLLKSGLYHSRGTRRCPGQAFTKYFRDAFFDSIADLSFKEKKTTLPSERYKLAGNKDVPISPERHHVCWKLKRDSLRLNYHRYKGRRFYDVLETNENPVQANKIVTQIASKIKYFMIKQQTENKDVVIVAPEVRGLAIAGMVAHKLGLPLVTIRKKGNYKMSEDEVLTESYSKGYGQEDCIELPLTKKRLLNNKKIFILDDGIASGGSALACIRLLNKFNVGVKVKLVLAIVNHLYATIVPSEFSKHGVQVKTLYDIGIKPPLKKHETKLSNEEKPLVKMTPSTY